MRSFPAPTQPSEQVVLSCPEAKLSDPHSYVVVLEDDGDLIGYISGYCHLAFYAGSETAGVDELLIHENRRGEGWGRSLMEGFEKWAALQSCVLVSLATAGAGGFYEAIGYTSKAGYYKKYLA